MSEKFNNRKENDEILIGDWNRDPDKVNILNFKKYHKGDTLSKNDNGFIRDYIVTNKETDQRI